MKKFLFIFYLFVIYSCEKPDISKTIETSKKLPIEPVNITSLPIQERKKYSYEGLYFRDPFIPLSGEKMAKAKLGLSKDAIVPSLGILQIKGIIIDKKDTIALFTSSYGSYMFVNGKLYDSQNRLVKGITGKIVSKENSTIPKGVVLITEDNEFREYFLPDKFKK